MRLDLEFARVIDATPEEVFDAFTDPEASVPTIELREEHERGLPKAFARLERFVTQATGRA